MPPASASGASKRPRSAARKRNAADTKTRILDAAEALFIEQGFVATSLRAITSRAGVNLAAAHYHFGSKEGLLGAAFHRRVEPLNATRLEALDALLAEGHPPDARELMRAFLEPLAGVDPESPMPRLVGRLFGEPDAVARPLLEREFSEVAARFFAALREALPDQSPEVIRWRFYFVVGAMIHLLAFDKPPVPLEPPVDPADGIEQLIDFAVNGLDPHAESVRDV
ncbi:MAG: TetR/AcrR family transcriptional regulator [Myxococcota bacterium]|jgi:AcrR family transcriptional regulator|nr:TetR/AcrR family transcriptional regulator [Myxococcota bacterium]